MSFFSKWLIALSVSSAAIALASCETAEGYRQQVAVWHGQDADDLMIQWGPPDEMAELSDGRLLWVYKKIEERHGGGYYDQEFVNRSYRYRNKDGKVQTRHVTDSYPVWIPPYTTRHNCNTHFVVSPENTVLDITFNGQGCVAPEM